MLVFHKSASLPDRCIKCNEPALGVRVNKKAYWHHPLLALLLLAAFVLTIFALLLYAIIVLVLRKTARLDLGFCQAHKSQRTVMLIATWSLAMLSLAGFVVGIAELQWSFALIAVGLLMGSAVLSLMAGRYIRVKKIDDYYVWLNGVNAEYLDGFPSL